MIDLIQILNAKKIELEEKVAELDKARRELMCVKKFLAAHKESQVETGHQISIDVEPQINLEFEQYMKSGGKNLK